MILVRNAEPDDRAGVDLINKEFDAHEYSHSSGYLDDTFATKNILVAVEEDEVVGYLIFHIIWGNTPFVELLKVPARHQRKGVGTQLLSSLESHLKTAGHTVLLSSSEKVNDMGNAFHVKSGFKSIGKLDMIYGTENFYSKHII